jgi:hypothetical protein
LVVHPYKVQPAYRAKKKFFAAGNKSQIPTSNYYKATLPIEEVL